MRSRIVDTPLGPVLDEMLKQRESLEDDSPCAGSRVVEVLPNKSRNGVEPLVVKCVSGNIVEQRRGCSPVLVRENLVDTGLYVRLGLVLVVSVGKRKLTQDEIDTRRREWKNNSFLKLKSAHTHLPLHCGVCQCSSL